MKENRIIKLSDFRNEVPPMGPFYPGKMII